MRSPAQAISFAQGEDLESSFQPLHDILQEAARSSASSIAIVCMHQPNAFLNSITRSPPADYLRWTFEELVRASHAFAQALAAAGIRPGMRIAAFVYNDAEFNVILRASLELNCVFAPLNPKTLHNAAESKHVIQLLQPSVVIVPNGSAAKDLENAAPESAAKAIVKLVCGGQPNSAKEWLQFEDFTINVDGRDHISSLRIVRDLDDVCLVLMTSGTTSMPKGCPHTSRSYLHSLQAGGIALDLREGRSGCCHVSTFHIFGTNWTMLYHIKGLKVVYPAPTFNAGASLQALRLEKCTDLPAVPAMITAMRSHPDFTKETTSCVKLVTLGGTTVLPGHYKMAIQEMGVGRAVGTFAMTEHGISMVERYNDKPDYERTTDGRPTPGYKVRVCKHESKEILPRGERGEIHVGGPGIIDKYWLHPSEDNKGQNDVFYDDTEGHWLVTGDEGMMEDDDHCLITGRYKDLIIRGGENISPSAIESVLLSRFHITAEVVAFADEIAGEVPVALVKKRPEEEIDATEVKETLVKELGPSFILESMIDIKSLGLEEFPRTPTGKVKKNELRTILKEYWQQKTSKPTLAGKDIQTRLLDLWTSVLGIRSGTLKPETSLADWADSLIMARFSAVLHREAGLSISLHELAQHGTIEKQARFLSSQTSSSSSNSDLQSNRKGPPSVDDMVHTNGNPEIMNRTRSASEKVLEPLGLSWDHVEDVTPIHDFLQRLTIPRRLQSFNHRHAWLCPGISPDALRNALESALEQHSLLRSVAIELEGLPYHVSLRPSKRLFSSIISSEGPVKSASELSTILLNDPKRDFATYPGPMFKAIITYVEEESCAGLLYVVQHSAFDGVCFSLFLDDLHSILENPGTPLVPHVPFKTWSDMYFSLKDSLAARRLVDWHVRRLSGVGSKSASLFPYQRAPGWFKGDTARGWKLKKVVTGWDDLTSATPGPDRQSLDDTPSGVVGFSRTARLADFDGLRKGHNLKEYALMKAALAITCSRYTETDTALFAQGQAGRTWPFVPDWVRTRLPPAMDIAGPCVQNVVNMITISPSETVISLLIRVQSEQAELTAHESAPLFSVVKNLGEDDRNVMEDVMNRQAFNWLPPMTSGYRSMQRKQILSRADIGLLWNCVMVERDTVCVMPSWDDAQLRRSEVEEILGVYLDIAEQLAKKDNWEKTIGELRISKEKELLYRP